MVINVLTLSGLIIFITSFGLTLLLVKFGKTQVQRMWMLFNISVCVWGLGTWGIGWASDPFWIEVSWKTAICGGLAIGLSNYLTVHFLTGLANRILLITVCAYTVLFMALTLAGQTLHHFRLLFGTFYFPSADVSYTVMVASYMILVVGTFLKLAQYYRNTTGALHTQSGFLLFGTLIGYVGGLSVLVPAFGILIYPAGNFSIAVYAAVVTYAILKHQMLDLEVIIRRTLIFSALFTTVIVIYSLTLTFIEWLMGKYLGLSPLASSLAVVAIVFFAYVLIKGIKSLKK